MNATAKMVLVDNFNLIYFNLETLFFSNCYYEDVLRRLNECMIFLFKSCYIFFILIIIQIKWMKMFATSLVCKMTLQFQQMKDKLFLFVSD